MVKTSSHRHYSVDTDPFVFGIPMEIGQYDHDEGGEEGKKERTLYLLMTAVGICSDVHDDKPRG